MATALVLVTGFTLLALAVTRRLPGLFAASPARSFQVIEIIAAGPEATARRPVAGLDAPSLEAQPFETQPFTGVFVVRRGDTLWSVARRLVGPGGDPRPVVAWMMRANGLTSGRIYPGQSIQVPAWLAEAHLAGRAKP